VTARAFAEAGAALVLAARNKQALDSIADSVRAARGRALAVPCDVGDAPSAQKLVHQVMSTFGRLHAAVNNATDDPLPAPLADIDPADFDRGIRPNIRETFLGINIKYRRCSNQAEEPL
jgi:NAD(P)-dependent dehydrogenase (short-subunit alcohol dehydrogenase family)